MIVTLEKAKKKDCPFCFAASKVEDIGCEANGCMAWRWWNNDHKYGYCGLAGRPQDRVS